MPFLRSTGSPPPSPKPYDFNFRKNEVPSFAEFSDQLQAWTNSLELAEALEYAETVNHRNTAVANALGRRDKRRAPMTLGQRTQRALAGRSWG